MMLDLDNSFVKSINKNVSSLNHIPIVFPDSYHQIGLTLTIIVCKDNSYTHVKTFIILLLSNTHLTVVLKKLHNNKYHECFVCLKLCPISFSSDIIATTTIIYIHITNNIVTIIIIISVKSEKHFKR